MADTYSVIGRLAAAPTVPATILLMVNGATKRSRLVQVTVGSHNSTTANGAEITIGRPTTSGTGGAATTPVALDPAAPAAIFTSLSGSTIFSAEPTQPANYDYRIALDTLVTGIWTPPREFVVPVSGRVGFRIESDSSTTKVQWTITAHFEEG